MRGERPDDRRQDRGGREVRQWRDGPGRGDGVTHLSDVDDAGPATR